MLPIRVLVACSHTTLGNVYRNYLASLGYVVTVAWDGLDCLGALRTIEPNVLVLDTSLLWGGCDGVLAVLREEPLGRRPLVVVLASEHEAGLMYRLAALRVDYFENMPISVEDLEEVIQGVMGQTGGKGYCLTSGVTPPPWKGVSGSAQRHRV